MSKYNYIVAIEPVGNHELGIDEFIQESEDSEHNIIYLYVEGDNDVSSLDLEDLPSCGHEWDDHNCMCDYGETLVQRVIKHYENHGMSTRVITMGGFVSPL